MTAVWMAGVILVLYLVMRIFRRRRRWLVMEQWLLSLLHAHVILTFPQIRELGEMHGYTPREIGVSLDRLHANQQVGREYRHGQTYYGLSETESVIQEFV